MGKKVISNTFTVNTIEDGNFPQQIFRRTTTNQLPTTPATSQSDAAPDGWNAYPQGVNNTYKYEWVSMRIKSDGVWGAYSTPAIYAYFAEDGTSIKILGTAVGIDTYPTNPQQGDTVLMQSFNTEDIDVYDNGVWEAYEVEDGNGYIYEGHLWVKNSTAQQKWTDVGQIKGEKGDDAVMYVLEPSIPQFNTDQNRTKTQTCTVRAYKIEGKTKSAFTGCFEIDPVVPAGMPGSSSYQNGNNISFGTNDDRNAIAYDVSLWDKNPLFIRVGEPEPVLLASINIPIAFDGTQGERGKIGRFFYFGGTFNQQDSDPTHGFEVNDAQAPYFEHTENGQKRYHVFNYDTNGTYTMAQMWAISSNWNNKPWEVMTNDFKYIITQALFAAYAHLGSWIFNGDYMLSEKDANGNPRGQQEYNGMGDSQLTSGFIPSIAFDALNGRASFGGDKVRFQPNGAGWLANKNIQWDANGNANFNGTITAMMYYAFPYYLPDGQYTIDLINEPHLLFISDARYSDVVLPSASTYDGIELQFIWVQGTRARLGYLKFVSPIFVREKDEFGNINIIQKSNAYIETLSVVKLKSLLGNWYMVSGELTDRFTPT